MNYSFRSVDKRSGELLIDSSNIANGYFFAAVSKRSPQRYKLRITKGSNTLTYDLKNDGTFEIFPL
jgi:hypothetical protein